MAMVNHRIGLATQETITSIFAAGAVRIKRNSKAGAILRARQPSRIMDRITILRQDSTEMVHEPCQISPSRWQRIERFCR